ncbi:hypothetical protein [Actinomadura madurae]|nr:hypothetical protein [Actinomadura madurae]
MTNVRPGGVGVFAPPTATFHRPTVRSDLRSVSRLWASSTRTV